MKRKIFLSYKTKKEDVGKRIDSVTAREFPEYSRAHIQKWIKDGSLLLNNREVKPKQCLDTHETIQINATEEPLTEDAPENIPFDIIHEDEDIIIVNKQPGLVVHPGAGNRSGTLVNALLNHNESLGFLPRAGIVHRLDKDTSGVMVVAKNEISYLNIISQLKERTVKRHYLAIVIGDPLVGSTIDEPIGRHPKQRTKQAVIETGKQAITTFKIKEKINGYSLLNVSLKTGRTHQIRVHLAYLNYPILGDSLYGGRKRFAPGTNEDLKKEISQFSRQALHAEKLEFIHPGSGKKNQYFASLPIDMNDLIESLRGY
ncbi:MAG TPA: RluA family pseudouridine synthase [SAR86 cluster bacterium]|nr:RluA family pseudouridine synthase [SAR86 cluster bacterium]|tara:strand:- start:357 stop:1301 length:945 start_codon:yes stop_codon:yes gene_type:complete